jgi:lipopolysaccharide transport system ATP-binding protein
MSEKIIIVDKLSKRYRIGAREQGYRTIREAIIDGLMGPVRNFKRLRKLTNFGDTEWNPIKGSSSANTEMNNTPDDVIWALNDVSFEVCRGEVVGIIGRNGAGKSTLLKILSRITEPTIGEVNLYGRISSLLEVGTGFHPELTGRENIFLNGAILGMRKAEIENKFDDIVAFADIEKFIDTPVKRYSSGMYVRLAFAVAANLEPEILVVDEVLAVGDVAFQKKCMGKMSEVAKGGKTVMLVSHNMEAIRNLCERVILLDEGRLVMDDNADRTIKKYLDRNLIEGTVASESDLSARMHGVIKSKDPYIRFREIALTDRSGLIKNSFYSDEDIIVSVSFECLQSVRDLWISVYIGDENNVPILESQNVDDPAVVDKFCWLDPGIFNASCILPANTFGGRTLYLTVHLQYPKMEHLIVDKILEFEVIFRGYNLQYGNRSSVFIRPRLNWNLDSKH